MIELKNVENLQSLGYAVDEALRCRGNLSGRATPAERKALATERSKREAAGEKRRDEERAAKEREDAERKKNFLEYPVRNPPKKVGAERTEAA